MIEKEAVPEIMEVDVTAFATPEPVAMKPINNFSPWYSAWSKIKFKDLENGEKNRCPEACIEPETRTKL